MTDIITDIDRLDFLRAWHAEQARNNERAVHTARSPWTTERYMQLAAHHNDAVALLARVIREGEAK